MKTKFLIGLLFIVALSWSQNTSQPKNTLNSRFSVFAHAGTDLINSQYYHSKSIPGYHLDAGASLLLAETPSISIFTQLSFQWYNAISELHSQSVNYRLNQSFIAVQTAFYIKYDKYKWQPKIGAFVNRKLTDWYTYEIEKNQQIIYQNKSDGGTFYNFQWGFLAGIEKPVNDKIILECTYQYLESHEALHGLHVGVRLQLD